jgi:hypothetical protein
MRKIRLDVDALAVESFDTARTQDKKTGTVIGHDATLLADGCTGGGCFSQGTCFRSCGTDYRPCIEPYC